MKLHIEQISKRFDGKIVLNEFTHVFEDGKINCILGESGSGKTTLLNIIMGLVKPESGRIQVETDGTFFDIVSGDTRIDLPPSFSINTAFQDDRLCEHLSTIKNISLVASESVSNNDISSALTHVGLGDSMKKPVSKLSGGMKRRVALVRALINQADLILLDEPFKGLDKAIKATAFEYVRNNTQNSLVIMVTHEEKEGLALGARMFRFDNDKLTQM